MYIHSCLRARISHAGGDRSTTHLKIDLGNVDKPLIQGWGAVSGSEPSERLFRQHDPRFWVHLIANPKCQYTACSSRYPAAHEACVRTSSFCPPIDRKASLCSHSVEGAVKCTHRIGISSDFASSVQYSRALTSALVLSGSKYSV